MLNCKIFPIMGGGLLGPKADLFLLRSQALQNPPETVSSNLFDPLFRSCDGLIQTEYRPDQGLPASE